MAGPNAEGSNDGTMSDFRPYIEGTWDNVAFFLKTETPFQEITMRTMLPLTDYFSSPFVGKRPQDIIEDFVQSHESLKGRRHLFSSHCFVILDEQTDSDHNTVSIWSDSRGQGWETRRCEFGALLYHLHLLESLVLGLHHLCAEDDILTVKTMNAERKAGRQKRRNMGLDVPE